MSFTFFQLRLTGISSVMLSKSLEELEQSKLVNRVQYNEIPPRVEYSLTPLGKAIHPALKELSQWGEQAYHTIHP
ncbi:winged helix-turn-helix transcriptional regulator [Enterocloster citroniae]